MKGHHIPHTEESKRKISNSKKGKPNSLKGKPLKIEHIVKLRESHKGHKQTEETKRKIRLAKLGEKHPNWKGGITPLRKKLYFSEEYQEWRSLVFERDNWTCQTCQKRGYLEAHHIKEWKSYPLLRFDVNNGVSLCKECHNLTKKGRGTR